MEMCLDCQQDEFVNHRCDSGVYRLWLAVTLSAVESFKISRGKNEQARSFLFEENNLFVEAVCDQLEISSEAMRERIQKNVTSWC